MASYLEARDDIAKLVTDAWVAQYPTTPLFYWNIPHEVPEGNDTDGNPLPWGRLTIQHQAGSNDAIGNKLFDREGLVTIQIFTAYGEGSTLADNIAKVVTDSLQGKSTSLGVWFRNVRLNEIGQDGAWFNVNVLADFKYCEVL